MAENDERSDTIKRAVAIVNQYYGCSDHDQPSHCADCALRHKVIHRLVEILSEEERAITDAMIKAQRLADRQSIAAFNKEGA